MLILGENIRRDVNNFIEGIKKKANYKARIKHLENRYEELLDYTNDLRIKTSNKYKIIYNPLGKDLWFINKNNTIYIQGKPKTLDGFRVDEILKLNEDDIDFEWYNKAISPMLR